jgi:hypothetical protein
MAQNDNKPAPSGHPLDVFLVPDPALDRPRNGSQRPHDALGIAHLSTPDGGRVPNPHITLAELQERRRREAVNPSIKPL